jgi:hypothetical protein
MQINKAHCDTNRMTGDLCKSAGQQRAAARGQQPLLRLCRAVKIETFCYEKLFLHLTYLHTDLTLTHIFARASRQIEFGNAW